MRNVFLLFFSISSVFGNNCFTQNDVLNSNKLFSYKNNVYDITGYSHPSGKSDLLKTVSNDLSVFFIQSKYKFHVGRSNVNNDLKKMLVGSLKDTCADFTTLTTTTNLPTEISTVKTKKTSTVNSTTVMTITTNPTTVMTTTTKSKKNKKNKKTSTTPYTTQILCNGTTIPITYEPQTNITTPFVTTKSQPTKKTPNNTSKGIFLNYNPILLISNFIIIILLLN